MSYWLAVPVVPSSPGAVQVSTTVCAVVVPVARFAIAAGAVVSVGVVGPSSSSPQAAIRTSKTMGNSQSRLENQASSLM